MLCKYRLCRQKTTRLGACRFRNLFPSQKPRDLLLSFGACQNFQARMGLPRFNPLFYPPMMRPRPRNLRQVADGDLLNIFGHSAENIGYPGSRAPRHPGVNFI